jgi:hypothetical protein
MRAARTDANQSEIVAMLRKAGYSVTPTHMVGKGFPDLTVGKHGKVWLLEVKDGSKPPSARKLTDDEWKWHDAWRGHVAVVESPEQALEAVRA